ncbi:MAG: murein biosynthesis integral membrane protein MurJ [Candidatus Krumholzibacteriia bacterium]
MSVATFLSRIGGLVRELLFAALLGAGFYSDAFVVAFRVPNLLRDLLAEGALSTAFVPTFTQYLVRENREKAYALGNLVLTTLLVVTGVVVVGGFVLAEPIVHFIAPGFSETPGKVELTALLTRIMFPFLTMVALSAVLMGMLNAQRRFFVPAVAPALFNASAIVIGFALLVVDVKTRTAVLVWTLAVLLGGLLQMCVQVPSLARLGWRFRPRYRPRFDDPGLRQILRLMAPAVVGLSATQVNILINNILASQLEQGSPSWINYAFRLMQLPIGVFGVAVATVNLAAVSRHAASGDLQGFRATLSDSLRLVAFLTLPATAGLVALREPIIGLLYEHGRFTAFDTARTAAVVSMYAVGLYAYASVKVLAPAFYALKSTRVPLLASVAAVVCNIVANLLLYRRMGAPGLALGTSIGALVNAGVLYTSFVRRYGSLGERQLLSQIARVLLASAVMGAICRLTTKILERHFGTDGVTSDLLVALPPILLGVAMYFILASVLRVQETRQALRLASRFLRRSRA